MPITNDISLLHPSLKAVYEEAKTAYHKAHPNGPRVELNETHRSIEVMTAYYAQGRKPLAEINKLREKAGLYLLGEAEAKRVVTHSLPGQSRHASLPAEAFDVKMIDRVTGKAIWTDAPFLLFAGFIKVAAAKLKIRVGQGAYWPAKKRDLPHTELAR